MSESSGSGPNIPLDLSTAVAQVKAEVQNTLTQLGHNASAYTAQIDKFMQEIAPDIAEATASYDLMSLGYIRGRIAMRLGRVSLGALYQEQQVITQTVMTTLSLLIKMALGAIVAAA